jgi:uncharacterized protein
MLVVGLISAAIIGMVLGTLGGGGSILTVPVLVYLLGVPAVEATAYSLFTVGVAALVGAGGYLRARQVDLRTALIFAPPSLVAVYLTRRFLIPAIPQQIVTLDRISVTRDTFILALFAVTMVLAAISMIRGCLVCARREADPHAEPPGKQSLMFVLVEGAVVGTITGLVGAGGGFLIIPALVLIGHLPMKKAVGTSLVIITAKSLVGFLGDLGAATALDWGFLLPFTGVAVIGIVAGMALSRSIDGSRLRPAFGWFVLAMGAFMTVQQVVAATGL